MIVILLVVPSPHIHSQEVSYFTNLNQSNGLGSGDVMCFQQDSDGFIWIGTKYGINVYDGSNFNTLNFSNSIPYNADISSLQLGLNNSMWIGTNGDGLYQYQKDQKKLKQYILNNGLDTTSTITCLEYWNDLLWVGTDQGLFYIADGKTAVKAQLGSGKEYIIEIAIHQGNLLVSTQDLAIFQVYKNKQVKKLNVQVGQVNAILSLDDGQLLLGTQYDGLYCINTSSDSLEIKNYNNLFHDSPPVINEIILDRSGNIWIGTDGEGLFRIAYVPGNIKEVNNFRFNSNRPNSIASNAIFSLFEDKDNKLWIGTIWKGLSILDLQAPLSALIYSDLYGQDPYPVLSVYSEGNDLWVGTDGKGINIIEDGEKIKEHLDINSTPSLSGNYIQHIFKDSDGLYWIGTFSSGLNCLNQESGQIITYINDREDPFSISYNDVRMILEDKNKDLWIATWGGGLNYFQRSSGTFKNFLEEDSVRETPLTRDMTSICWSHDQNGIWIGTFGHGLHYFDLNKKQFSRISGNEFERLKILSLYLDSKGFLWIGTWGNGLIVYNTNQKKRAYNESLLQLENSRVTAIEEDLQGSKWISSKNGIYKFDTSDSSLYRWSMMDQISSKEFHINASCTDHEGNIYFGGLSGVVRIAPDLEDGKESINPPLITNIFLFNEDLPTLNIDDKKSIPELRLDYNQNFITFSFSSPYYPISDVIYSYRLENYNDTWLQTQGDRATFQNLPPGKYIFAVRSSIHNLDWSKPALLRVIIAQPIWKTWYAYVIYISIFILLLYLFQKYTRDLESMRSNLKLESLKREQEEELHTIKQRFFTNISHEIRTPVTLILGATNKLVKDSTIHKAHQKEITVLKNSSWHLLNLINELLDFRRIDSGGIRLKMAEGNFQKFAHEIYLSFVSQAFTNSIDYRFTSRDEEMKLWFDRDQMEKVIYNLISNAFKYTPRGGIVTVEVDQDDQYCYLKVIDSGTGIPEEKLKEIFKRFYQSENASNIREQGFGLGLSISGEIVKMHGGEIYAKNNDVSGICISAKLPKGSRHIPDENRIKDFRNSENLENYVSDKLTISTSLEDLDVTEDVILIVEDNEHLRDYLKEMFSGKMNVSTAKNGDEGLKLATEILPDIIVSDVMMPIMDGVSMTKVLKTNVITSHIPVILLTARTNLIYKKEGFDIGADDYITKPFNEVLLRTRVMNILRNRKQFREKLSKEFLSNPKENLNISTPDQKFLSDLTAIIEKNLEEQEISASLIASELGMSHSVVYKKVKALLGMSLIEFTRDFKLKRAAHLLSKYQLSVSDVCYRVGFSDRRYFSKLFKAKYGKTPSEFAREN